MATLLNATITTAAAGTTTTAVQMREGAPASAVIQATLTYGSGGTSATAYVQTSFDGGTSWVDAACFAFTTSTAVKVANLSAATAVTTLYTPTDGSLTDNTVKDGLLGPLWRVKYTTVGTYAASTKLRIDIAPRGSKATSLT